MRGNLLIGMSAWSRQPGPQADLSSLRAGVLERLAGPFSLLAVAVLASSANFLADGPAPSWLVRVGPFLGAHFPARSLSLYRGRPGLLLWELGRRLPAPFPAPIAKETHGAIVDRRLTEPRLAAPAGSR